MTPKSDVGAIQLEQELFKSLRNMQRDNLAAKKDLKALYDHKISKIKDELTQEMKQSEAALREQLKFQKHSAGIHKRRADNYKTTAD